MKITLGENHIDLENFNIVLKNNATIELTRSEKCFLACVYDSDRVASYDDLINFIWGSNDEDKTYKSVQEIWSSLKKKAPFLSKYVKNIRGQGYQRENNKKIDSPFVESLYTMLSSSYPEKRGTNTQDKPITMTRYALFALVKKQFPDETELLSVLGDSMATPKEIMNKLSATTIINSELCSLLTSVVFDWHLNDNGIRTGLIVVKGKGDACQAPDAQQIKNALGALVDAYLGLGAEFHNNVKSLLKREVNTTVSQLTLAAAYKEVFNKSEQTRAELLTICDALICTHNHHNIYLYSLIERTRDDAYLFKPYRSNDYECTRAIKLFENFFMDNWRTEQSASYVGNVFLQWCEDKQVIFDLINSNSYDSQIWLGFALKHNGKNTLRQKVYMQLFKNINVHNEEHVNHIVSFLQMITKGNFKCLAFNPKDEKYNAEVRSFIKSIVKNLPAFPLDKQRMMAQGVRKLLSDCDGMPSEKHRVAKKILAEIDVDWSLDCFKQINMFREKLQGKVPAPQETPNVTQFVEGFAKLLNKPEKTADEVEEAADRLRILLLDKTFVFDDKAKRLANDITNLLFARNDLMNNYGTILATASRLYLFPDETYDKINRFAKTFLKECDFSKQTNISIERALIILKKNDFTDAQICLENCFINLSRMKKCRPVDMLLHLLEGLTLDRILDKIEAERDGLEKPYSKTINWLLADKDNGRAISQNLHHNIIFEFVDKLIDKSNQGVLSDDLSLSIVHFAKRQDCFAEKVPSSDEFYSELLLEADRVRFDSAYLKEKAIKHKLSFNTALFHLCKVLKDDPQATAYICIEYLAKFFGQLEYSYYHPQSDDLRETHLFQKRKEIFSLLISNPAIRNTAKLYCARMRRFAKILPTEMIELITDVVNKDIYPEWFSEIVVEKEDAIQEQAVWLSVLSFVKNDRPAGEKLGREINERLMPWLELATEEDVYDPIAFIYAIKKDNTYTVVDGNRTVNHFVEESIAYGDFKIKIQVVEL